MEIFLYLAIAKPRRYALALCVLASLLNACGADVKSAGDVSPIFSGDATSLASKLEGLCSQLRQRSEEPTLTGTSLAPDGCNNAGLAALNITGLERFQFLGLNDAAPADGKIIHFGLRSQLWLNKGLLDLASAVGSKLKAKDGQTNKGLLDQPSSLGKAGGPIQFSVNIIDEPKIDISNFHFSMTLNFKATGIVDVDNTLAVSAQLIDNKIAMHAKTTTDMPFEKSLLKNAEVLINVIPHAGDIYLDAQIDANLYSPVGVADEAIKSKAEDLISGMLKPAIDSLLNLSPAGGA